MMFPSLYEELDMSRYACMVKDMLSQEKIMLALCDDSGQVVWSNDSEQGKSIINNGVRKYSGNAEYACDFVEQNNQGNKVIYCHLGELSGRSVGELVFYGIDKNCLVDEAVASNAISLMCNMAVTVKKELDYLYEVNSMAKELGERYDELSILRSSEVALTEYREARHILSTYIRSYTEHLDIDYAAIWIPSRKAIYPGGVSYKNDSTGKVELLERLSLAAYKMFKNGHDSFGINSSDDDLRGLLGIPDKNKALFVPVLDEKQKPCGVLVCINASSKEDFSSSNQSTLEAIARKTYKYLRNTRDDVTGFLNRKGFEESVRREITQTKHEKHLVLFNINQFSVINAAYGTVSGDIVLSSVANALSRDECELKFVSRLDSDVFAALIVSPKRDVEKIIKDICEEIDDLKVSIDNKKVTVNLRAGVIAVNSKETEMSDHLYAAELALTSAKENLSDRVVVYKPGNAALLKQRHQLTQVENIKLALQEDRFELHCQRIEPLASEEVHYEILVRMISETGDLIAPDEFIPVAERYNLMGAVDRWVIKNTFKLLESEEYRDISNKFIWGINLSGMTISDPRFHEYVSDCLHEYNFPPANLYFEITETAAIKSFQNCVSFMNKIHSLGVQFALDDFGSGLSSFNYLKKLSIDYLKIDGSLIRDIVNSELDQTMVAAVSEIAKVMNVKTIAEYVENESILNKLRSLNIDYVQGYGIMKPQPVTLELNDLVSRMQYKLSSNQ